MRLVVAVIMAATAPFCAFAADPGWEHTAPSTAETTAAENIRAGSERAEIWVRDGFIYVNAPRRTTVHVFTILGQTVSSQQLQAGISRLRVPTRGIYLVRIDNTTRRVNV